MYSSRMRTAHLLSVSPSMHSSRKCTWSGGYTWSRGVYLVLGGVPGPEGGGGWSQGGRGCTWCWGVYLVRGVLVPGGVPGPRGGGGWSQGGGGVPGAGGCTWYWGVYLVPGGTCPGTPPCEKNHRRL